MLKIYYDYQIFYWQKYGGISRYIYELTVRLLAREDLSVKILAMAYVNEYLKRAQPGLVFGWPVPKIPTTGNLLNLLNSELSKVWLNNNPPDIIHETFYRSQRLAPKGTKVVVTVHDMIYEKFYPGDQIVQHKAATVKRADRVICVSENTKKDLINLFGVDSSKISVVYHGCSLGNHQHNTNQSNASIHYPYILYVGDRYGYKNFQRLLEAYASSKRLYSDFKLVCFGGAALHPEELSSAHQLGIPEGAILQVSGDDATLESFYRGASAFIYPSLYEGFGIPLLEAMSLGCPVVCSNTSSMPEVVGNAAELFDPYDTESIAATLEKVLYSPEKAKSLISLGSKRVKLFSWETCAEETRQVYLSLV